MIQTTTLPSYVHTNSNKQDKEYYSERHEKYYQVLDSVNILNIEAIKRLVISYLFIRPIIGANEWHSLAGVTVPPCEELQHLRPWWEVPFEPMFFIHSDLRPLDGPKEQFSFTLIPLTVNSEPLTLTVFKKLVEDKFPNITLNIDAQIMERGDINRTIEQLYYLALPKSILRNKQGENQDLNFEAIPLSHTHERWSNLAEPLEAVISIVMQNVLYRKQCTISMTPIPDDEITRAISIMSSDEEDLSDCSIKYSYPIAISVSYGEPQSQPRLEGLKIRRVYMT